MKAKWTSFSIMTGLIIVPVLLVGVTVASAPMTHEMNLTPGGNVYEVDPDSRGNLWFGDYTADQVWQLNSATGAYTIYQGLNAAANVRVDAGGDVWWLDFDNGGLGRLSLSTGTVTTWTIPGASYPQGLAFDNTGLVWATNKAVPYIFSFSPTSTQVCTYTVPDGGISNYITHHAGNLWLGDIVNKRLLKLDPTASQFTQWQLSTRTYIWGLAVDNGGDLWWADAGLTALARLEPSANLVTTYTLPFGKQPIKIAFHGEDVWYTEGTSGTFGMLHPATASGISATVVVTPAIPATASCSTLGTGFSSIASISTGVAVWTPSVVTTVVDSSGWAVYQLPPSAKPWGIAVNGAVWVADRGRDKLVWYPLYTVYLPVVMRN